MSRCVVAARRGTALHTTAKQYNSLVESDDTEVDRTETATSLIDYRGYAVTQDQETFVDGVTKTGSSMRIPAC